MSYDLWTDLDLHDERQRRIRDKRETRKALAEIESRLDGLADDIRTLLDAIQAIVTALALGETTLRDEHRHQHGLCGSETGHHLVKAARLLAMDLGELGLDYWDICPHGEQATLCNECQGGYYDASEAAPWEGPDEPYPPEEPWDSASDAGTAHAPAVHDH